MLPRAISKTTELRRGYRNWLWLALSIGLSKAGILNRDLVAVTRHGSRIVCPNVGSARSVLAEVYIHDEYDLAHFVPGMMTQEPIVLDIGAHVGIFTVSVCERFGNARVYCYEPSPHAFAYLSANVAQNALGDRVTVINKAVTARAGSLPFFADDLASGGNTLFTELPRDGQRQLVVESESFERVMANVPGQVDILKIDCEGSEYPIVLESPASAWSRVTNVLLEHHPVNGRSWDELKSKLTSLGFEERAHQYRGHEWGLGFFVKSAANARGQ